MNNTLISWVYIRSESYLWTVGFYDPKGEWQSESDWDNKEDAAKRVHYLNGGNIYENQELIK